MEPEAGVGAEAICRGLGPEEWGGKAGTWGFQGDVQGHLQIEIQDGAGGEEAAIDQATDQGEVARAAELPVQRLGAAAGKPGVPAGGAASCCVRR